MNGDALRAKYRLVVEFTWFSEFLNASHTNTTACVWMGDDEAAGRAIAIRYRAQPEVVSVSLDEWRASACRTPGEWWGVETWDQSTAEAARRVAKAFGVLPANDMTPEMVEASGAVLAQVEDLEPAERVAVLADALATSGGPSPASEAELIARWLEERAPATAMNYLAECVRQGKWKE